MDNAPRKAGRPPKLAPHQTINDIAVISSGTGYTSDLPVDVDAIVREIKIPMGFEPISTAPKTGDRIVVSETGQDAIAVFWRERRVVNKEKLRYEKKGGWTGVLSRLDIEFEPKFWRKYSAADYIPVPRTA